MLKACILAFSMYSNIPMPQLEWREEDMQYMLCFFPWVGAVAGACIYLWGMFCGRFAVGRLCYVLTGAAIPLLITGGFHVDGFLDTMDAFHSYQPREKKLEILKDSHIGAFAVIMLGVYGLIYLGAFSEIQDKRVLQIVCAGFVFARCLSALSVVCFPCAKEEGLLYQSAGSAEKRVVRGACMLQAVMCAGFMLWRSLYAGIMVVVAALCAFAYYGNRCRRELGGITGDTAGYFVLVCEGSMMVAAAVFHIVWG